jgi:hypothetical protein
MSSSEYFIYRSLMPRENPANGSISGFVAGGPERCLGRGKAG